MPSRHLPRPPPGGDTRPSERAGAFQARARRGAAASAVSSVGSAPGTGGPGPQSGANWLWRLPAR
eukprot:2960695-Alexandrium_andersonii.AAC.1